MLTNNSQKQNPPSDAKWYFDQFTGDRELYYDIFFQMCKKFGITWRRASQKEKRFIEEITRFHFEREIAKRKGIPLDTIRPVFDIA